MGVQFSCACGYPLRVNDDGAEEEESKKQCRNARPFEAVKGNEGDAHRAE